MDDLEGSIKDKGLRDAGGGDTYGPLSGYVAILAGLGLAVAGVVFLYFGQGYLLPTALLVGSLVMFVRGWRYASWPWRVVGTSMAVMVLLFLLIGFVVLMTGIDELEVGDCVTAASVESNEYVELDRIDCGGSEPWYQVVKGGTTSLPVMNPETSPCRNVASDYVVWEETRNHNYNYVCLRRHVAGE